MDAYLEVLSTSIYRNFHSTIKEINYEDSLNFTGLYAIGEESINRTDRARDEVIDIANCFLYGHVWKYQPSTQTFMKFHFTFILQSRK